MHSVLIELAAEKVATSAASSQLAVAPKLFERAAPIKKNRFAFPRLASGLPVLGVSEPLQNAAHFPPTHPKYFEYDFWNGFGGGGCCATGVGLFAALLLLALASPTPIVAQEGRANLA